jgi:hypothetical protein
MVPNPNLVVLSTGATVSTTVDSKGRLTIVAAVKPPPVMGSRVRLMASPPQAAPLVLFGSPNTPNINGER